MSDEEIGVYFSDPAYKQGLDAEVSEEFKRQLEKEYGLPFSRTSIGTGAAEGAYFAKLILDHWPFGVPASDLLSRRTYQ